MKHARLSSFALIALLALVLGLMPAYAFATDGLTAGNGAADLTTQSGDVIDNVQVNITPPKVGESVSSIVINLERGDKPLTSAIVAAPEGSGYYVEAYAFCNFDYSDLIEPLTLKSGDTYYMWVTLKGETGKRFNEAAKVTVSGAELLGDPEIYNPPAQFSDAHSFVNMLLSFQAVPAGKDKQTITTSNKTNIVKVNKTLSLKAKTSGDGKLTYKSSNTGVATVNSKGVITGKKAGTANVTITAAETNKYEKATKVVKITVKKQNTLVTKNDSKTLSYKTLKKKSQSFSPSVIKRQGKGTITYAKKSVTAKYKKYVTVSKAGKVTVKKGAPKGKCTLDITVKAAGTSTYAAATETAQVKITIK